MADKALAQVIGANIAAERKARRVQQTALAERLGLGQGSLSKIEGGLHAPSVELLLRIAEALGCTVTALLKGAEAESDAYWKGHGDGWRAAGHAMLSAVTRGPDVGPLGLGATL